MKDILEKYSLAQLKKIVRRSNIVGYTKFDKDGLIKKMMESQHKSNFKYLKKLKHDSVDDRKNNMKLVDGDLKVRRDENKAKREANKKKKADDLKAKVPALTERTTAKKAVKTTTFGPNKPPRGVMKKKAIPTITITESKKKGKTQKDYNVKTDKLKKVDKKLKLPKKIEIKKKVEKKVEKGKYNTLNNPENATEEELKIIRKKRKEESDKRYQDFLKANPEKGKKKKVEIKKRVNSSMANFKKSQEGKADIDTLNEFYKNIRMGKSSIYNKVSDIKSIIKILKSNNQKVNDNFSDSRREILLESAEEILDTLSSSKDKPKKEEKKVEPKIEKIEGKKKVFKKLDFEEKKKEPVKSKPIVYKTPMMKKEEKRIAKVKKDKAVKATQKAIDAFDKPKKKEDKPKKKEDKSSKSTNNKKELFKKYMDKYKKLDDPEIRNLRSQKPYDKDKAEEKVDELNKVIISLETDMEKTPSNRLKELYELFKTQKKLYIRAMDAKNE